MVKKLIHALALRKHPFPAIIFEGKVDLCQCTFSNLSSLHVTFFCSQLVDPSFSAHLPSLLIADSLADECGPDGQKKKNRGPEFTGWVLAGLFRASFSQVEQTSTAVSTVA